MGAFPLPPTYPVDVRAAQGGGVFVNRVGTSLELSIDPTSIPSGDGIITGYASTVVSGHRALRTTPIGLAHYSAGDTSQFSSYVGVSLNAALIGAQVMYRTDGPIDEPTWTWTPGLPVYAGDDGQLTQVEPVNGVVQPVGTAATATRVLLAHFPPTLL